MNLAPRQLIAFVLPFLCAFGLLLVEPDYKWPALVTAMAGLAAVWLMASGQHSRSAYARLATALHRLRTGQDLGDVPDDAQPGELRCYGELEKLSQAVDTEQAKLRDRLEAAERKLAEVEAAGGRAELAVDGAYAGKPDVAVVVFGEEPYAEFQGDISNLMFKSGKSGDLELMQKLKADGIPVVAVFLSGRPLWLNREINVADAFVAAWLPGSEGGGVADVLLRGADGQPQHDFKGKLSFSWPRRADQYLNNYGQEGYDPLFAFGFGLTYADNGDLAPLPEDPGVDPDVGAGNTWFERGVPAAGFTLHLLGTDGGEADVVQPAASTPDGALEMSAINHEVQEGARLFAWSGPATVQVASGEPLDLTRETNGDVPVVLTLRVDALPDDGKATLGAGCGEGCSGQVDIGEALAQLPRGEWTRLAVPLKCLRLHGADTGRLDVPFRLQAGAGAKIALARVAASTESDHQVSCPTN